MAYKQKNHPFAVTSCGRRRPFMHRKSGPPKATHTMPDGTIMPGAKHGPPKKDCNCWKGHSRVPGTKPCAQNSCKED